MSLSALRHSAMTKAFNNHHLCFPEFHPTGVFTQRAQLPHCAFMTNIYTDMGILADTICKGVFFFACRHGHAALTKKKKNPESFFSTGGGRRQLEEDAADGVGHP